MALAGRRRPCVRRVAAADDAATVASDAERQAVKAAAAGEAAARTVERRRRLQLSRRTLVIVGFVLLVVIGLGVGLPLTLSGSASGHGNTEKVESMAAYGQHVQPAPARDVGPGGPPLERGPNLAPTGSPPPGGSVDGIRCQGGEQLAEHTHARLTIFVNGHSEKVPYGVGIASPQLQPGIGLPFVVSGSCFSWLQAHERRDHPHRGARSAHLHPRQLLRRLGQPLSSTQVGPAKGKVTALYNGQVWLGDPRDIPLTEHALVQLESAARSSGRCASPAATGHTSKLTL